MPKHKRAAKLGERGRGLARPPGDNSVDNESPAEPAGPPFADWPGASTVLVALLAALATLLPWATLLARLSGLLARLLLPATLLLARLTRLRVVLLLLARVLVLLRHFLLLGGFSTRPKSTCAERGR